ncbi:hypothetical protein FBU30_006052 [Linnemannia zychae]|nr:hypothetical protein FBU30_006052 [Linnemannia zychae]
MKAISLALCLVALGLISNEETALASSSSRLERRGDPNGSGCTRATALGFQSMARLNKAIQGYNDPAVAKVKAYQSALLFANFNRNPDNLARVESTYAIASEAVQNAQGDRAVELKAALSEMNSRVQAGKAACS